MIQEEEACAILLTKINNIFINRNSLRSILKKNNISYHKPGPKNHMKSKKEMFKEVNKLALDKITDIINNNKKYVLL